MQAVGTCRHLADRWFHWRGGCPRVWTAVATMTTPLFHVACLLYLATIMTCKVQLLLCWTKNHNNMKAYGEMDKELHAFLSSAPGGSEWSASSSGRFNPGGLGGIWIGSGGSGKEKISFPPSYLHSCLPLPLLTTFVLLPNKYLPSPTVYPPTYIPNSQQSSLTSCIHIHLYLLASISAFV
jgi:hypothetical protein